MFLAFGAHVRGAGRRDRARAHAHRDPREAARVARRYVIVGAFVVAAIFTPPDVVSQLLLAIPMWLLYELGLFARALHACRRGRLESAVETSEPVDAVGRAGSDQRSPAVGRLDSRARGNDGLYSACRRRDSRTLDRRDLQLDRRLSRAPGSSRRARRELGDRASVARVRAGRRSRRRRRAPGCRRCSAGPPRCTCGSARPARLSSASGCARTRASTSCGSTPSQPRVTSPSR